MSIAYIGIGSNLGNREKNCDNAINAFVKKGIKIVKTSSCYETEPWEKKEQPKFINMAVEAETGLNPEELLKNLKEIEKELGRYKTERWGPRIIDLDILFYDDLVIKTAEFQIPHAGIEKREFVLEPLSEIAPDKLHPVLKKSIKQLLSELLKP